MHTSRSVTVTESGREGHVTYTEGLRAITGYQEFGGGDLVAIVSMGSADEWRSRHSWAMTDRAEILRHVAAEVIRQKAPTCIAEIDEARGDILLRASSTARPAAAPASNAAWVSRYAELKAKFAMYVLVAVLIVGFLAWMFG